MSQLSLDAGTVRPPTGREKVLASTLAGWCYPGRGSIDGLRKAEREACLAAARAAFEIAESARS